MKIKSSVAAATKRSSVAISDSGGGVCGLGFEFGYHDHELGSLSDLRIDGFLPFRKAISCREQGQAGFAFDGEGGWRGN